MKKTKVQVTLTLLPEQALQLRSEAAELGMNTSEYVTYLQDFRKLKYIHHIIRQLRVVGDAGFNHIQMAELSGLLTYLEHIRAMLQFR